MGWCTYGRVFLYVAFYQQSKAGIALLQYVAHTSFEYLWYAFRNSFDIFLTIMATQAFDVHNDINESLHLAAMHTADLKGPKSLLTRSAVRYHF